MLANAARSQVVSDARSDPSFSTRATTVQLGIGAYSGVTLYTTEGRLYGTLCTLHPEARRPAEGEIALLQLAGHIIMQAVEADMRRERERKLAHDLLLATERLHMVYDAVVCGVLVTDASLILLDANQAARQLLGGIPDGLFGRPLHEAPWQLLAQDGTPLPRAAWPSALAQKTWTSQRNTIVGLAQDSGSVRWLQVDSVPVVGDSREPVHVVTSFIDVTARLEAERQLTALALHDRLTGLPNRLLFGQRLDRVLGASPAQPAALLFVDLDGFKGVNDSRGHQAGDELLREVAARLRACVREEDTVARLAGDEFTVLLPRIARATNAAVVAVKIIKALQAPFLLDGQEVGVTASVGISLFPEDGRDAGTLLGNADHAMYTAKQQGKNRYAFASAAGQRDGDRDPRLSERGW